MKFSQRLVILLLVIIISLGASGCVKLSNNQPGSKDKNINLVAIDYMEKKYGEKFEYKAPYGNSMSSTFQLLVKSDSYPNQDILVQIDNYKKDNKTFSDNFLAVKYYKQTIQLIQNCADKQFNTAKVYYTVAKESLSPSLSAKASFNDFIKDDNLTLNFSVRTKASLFTSESQAKQFAESLASYKTHFICVLASVEDNQYNDESIPNANLNFVWRVQLTRTNENTEIDWLEKD